MTGFTPGPWKYEFNPPRNDWGEVRDQAGYMIARVSCNRFPDKELNDHRSNGTDPCAEDANLIAAAPDLYAALARLEGIVRLFPPSMDEPGSALEQAHAALAKARGETP